MKTVEDPHSMSKCSTGSRSYIPDTNDLLLDETKMYTVQWRSGKTFAFNVSSINSDRGIVLLLTRRVVSKDDLLSMGLEKVVPGDILVAIDREPIYSIGAEAAQERLRRASKPLRLCFQLSPYGSKSDQALPSLAPNEYNYHWEDGPLGIVLTSDRELGIPVVKRINTTEIDFSIHQNRSFIHQITVGDALVYVNNFPTCEYGTRATIDKIKTLSKPIVLRFRKPLHNINVEIPALREGEFDILWEYGNLGLVLGTSKNGVPFVRSFTGKGSSKQLKLVREGDELVLVNDRIARPQGFSEIMSYVQNVPKPAVLRFRRIRAESSNQEMEMNDRIERSDSHSQSYSHSRSGPIGIQHESQKNCDIQEQKPSSLSLLGYKQISSTAKVRQPNHNPPQPQRSGYIEQSNNGSHTQQMPDAAPYHHNRTTQSHHPYMPSQQVNERYYKVSEPSGSNMTQSDRFHQHGRSNHRSSMSETDHNHTLDRRMVRSARHPSRNEHSTQHSRNEHTRQYSQSKEHHQPSKAPRQSSVRFEQSTNSDQDTISRSFMENGQNVRKKEHYQIDQSAYYVVQWISGPFGCIVRGVQSSQGPVLLITKRTGKSTCAGLQRVAIGDLLIRIGDLFVSTLSFQDAAAYLRSVPKPVSLTFQAIT
uniref:Uncharacterized protein AlNc14C154G7604 n=1 Tax=Albugo laibachii Nc14 TaxID=890382 RepID=F0WM99_9STRA|nr:conserved hypothetical protein [Albugo laibachii Nc14]|eukprot:CCA22429.1 conserved hypothetical protein [Albugo laibachii Nc14]